jgi:AhpD family alkylhydroperoxidase
MTMAASKIDPALDHFGEFSELTKGAAERFGAMRQQVIFSDGVISSRMKALAAVLWAISARCEPCIKSYIQQAVRLGVEEAELGEFLAVASVMGGCVGEMWALKAFKAYKDAMVGEAVPESGPACCD